MPTPSNLVRRARGHAASLSYIDELYASESASLIDELVDALEAAERKLAALPQYPEPRVVWGVKWGDDPDKVDRRRNEAEARSQAELGGVVMRRLVHPPHRTEWVPADV